MAYINSAEINSITTANSSIIFNNKNVSAINTITATSNIITRGTFNSITSSNINTNSIFINNISMNSSNVHLTNKVSICSDAKNTEGVLNNTSTLMKITVNSNIDNSSPYYKNSDALSITNINTNNDYMITNNINPSISIIGKNGSYPLIKLSKNAVDTTIDDTNSGQYGINNAMFSDYFIRLAAKKYTARNFTYLEHFEVSCNNITENKKNYLNILNTGRPETNIVPSFIKHIKDYNLLCFGELNNVCIKCDNEFSEKFNSSTYAEIKNETFTNSTNKICLGIPFNDKDIITSKIQSSLEDWADYFNNIICNKPIVGAATSDRETRAYNRYSSNMLNIFGNVGISSISGNNILKANMNTNELYNDSGCTVEIGSDEPSLNSITKLNIYGGITSVTSSRTYASSSLMKLLPLPPQIITMDFCSVMFLFQ
jgi:hypothetical protein